MSHENKGPQPAEHAFTGSQRGGFERLQQR